MYTHAGSLAFSSNHIVWWMYTASLGDATLKRARKPLLNSSLSPK